MVTAAVIFVLLLCGAAAIAWLLLPSSEMVRTAPAMIVRNEARIFIFSAPLAPVEAYRFGATRGTFVNDSPGSFLSGYRPPGNQYRASPETVLTMKMATQERTPG